MGIKDYVTNVTAATRELGAAREEWRAGCGCTKECGCSDAPYARLKAAQEDTARAVVGRGRAS